MLKEYKVNYTKLNNGETIAYRQAGSGKQNLLLLHGNMSSSVHFDVLMEDLEKDYTVYALDLRGSGDSSNQQEANSLLDFAQDIKLWLEAEAITSATVLGWSTAGGIAIHLALIAKEQVERLILLNSVGIKGYPIFAKDENMQPNLNKRLVTKAEIAQDPVQVLPILNAYANKDKAFLKTVWNSLIFMGQEPEPKRVDRYLEASMKQRNLVDIDYALVHFNVSNESNGVCEGSNLISALKQDTLIIHGQNDLVVPIANAHEMKAALGAKASLLVYEDSGHAPIYDNLDRLLADIRNFLGDSDE